MTIGARIKARRKEIGLSVDEVADRIGKNRATVYRYESNEIEKYPLDILEPLAKALNTTPAYLMGWEETQKPAIPNHPQFLPLPKLKQWKVIGAVACGEPTHRELEELIWAPDSINADVVFRCEGDSMIGAHIFDGDIAFVRCGRVEDGQIAVVRVEDEYSLKRIYRGQDYLELRSENPKYPPIIIRGEQTNAEIVGKVVYFVTRPV